MDARCSNMQLYMIMMEQESNKVSVYKVSFYIFNYLKAHIIRGQKGFEGRFGSYNT